MQVTTMWAFTGFCFFLMMTITITVNILHPEPPNPLKSFLSQCSGGHQDEMIRCSEMAQKLGLAKNNGENP